MRVDHWEIALEQLVAERRETPFAYGVHDCCLFVADAVLAIAGVDIASEYRGKYGNATEAKAIVLATAGGATVEDAMDHACKAHEFMQSLPGVFYAQRGDVVSMVLADVITLGIVALDGSRAWFTGESLTKYPLSECHRAWGIR